MIIDGDDSETLAHYGIPRKSGRYPWGSGEDPQGSRTFLATVEDMRKNQGMTESQIAKSFGMSTADLRGYKSIALKEQTQAKIAMAQRLRDKGMSHVAIGERMGGIPESTVRTLLDPGRKDRATVLDNTANMLKNELTRSEYLDVGTGVERHLNISREKLDAAVSVLKAEGYQVFGYKMPQLGSNGQKTTLRVLARPEAEWSDFVKNTDKIRQVHSFSQDGGRSYEMTQPPLSISSKRVGVRYAEDGGSEADGTIYVRPGVKDVSLDGSRYAQVRIAVDGTHYLKGMAVYSNDMPDGVDLLFNTNKSDTGNKLDAMKPMKDDPEDPFGARISRQVLDVGSDGKMKVSSVMNIVNEEGRWDTWNKNLSSQVLSKQKPSLAKRQLGMVYDQKEKDLSEALKTQNPAVRKRLLQSIADDADSSAVHLKAASLPRQETKVILPIKSLKDNEIFAPTFREGESVVLIRFPHGGKFEIPQLKVNNRNAEAIRTIGKEAPDAVGINSRVAERLSGADFDGDTVLVIPNDRKQIETSPALEGLKNFDGQRLYKNPPGVEPMSAKTKQRQMGDITNLISDMTTQKASQEELARALRHSMVVIDAEKHNLDYKRSAQDNNIAQLKTKYQSGPRAGARTLITRATSEDRPLERKLRSPKDGGPIDRDTGKLVYVPTGNSYIKTKENKRTGEITEEVVMRTEKSTKLAETDDAFTLSSGTPIEAVYASHSNKLKALANRARYELVRVEDAPWSPSAKKVYAEQVATLNEKLDRALRNAPLERQAQIVANAKVRLKKENRPDMDDDELRKVETRELMRARLQVGAEKKQIEISDKEWEAIQAGAISKSKLNRIIDNADLDRLKELSMPRESKPTMSDASLSKAQTLYKKGSSHAEVADALGVSVSGLKSATLNRAVQMVKSGNYTQAEAAEAMGISIGTLKKGLDES